MQAYILLIEEDIFRIHVSFESSDNKPHDQTDPLLCDRTCRVKVI